MRGRTGIFQPWCIMDFTNAGWVVFQEAAAFMWILQVMYTPALSAIINPITLLTWFERTHNCQRRKTSARNLERLHDRLFRKFKFSRMKKKIILIVFLCFCKYGFSQRHKMEHVSMAFTTLHTAFPFGSFSRLFTEDLHPGLEIGTSFNWVTKRKHDWFQTIQFGYSYHRFIQHSIALYSEGGYRYKFIKSFSAEAKLGAGYLHAIPTGKIFKLENGAYEKKANLGRPQALVALTFNIQKRLSPAGHAVFIQYQQRLQLPFIKSYVPLLPSNMLMAGIKIPCRQQVINK